MNAELRRSQNERKIKKGGALQKQNGIKGREDTGEEHENFMLKGHWYEISDKNVQLAGSR